MEKLIKRKDKKRKREKEEKKKREKEEKKKREKEKKCIYFYSLISAIICPN